MSPVPYFKGVSHMRKQVYRKRRTHIRSLLLFGTAICLLLAFLIRIDHAIRPNLCAVCESETKQFTAGLMADSIAEVLQDQQMKNVSFAELTYDAAGNVTTMETRTDQINRLQSAIYRNVQQHLEQCRDAELEVSLGTASGVWLFAGRGPHVSVRLLPVGHASVKLISTIESAGINQTCHTIRAEVTAEVQTAIPFAQTTTKTTYACLLSETLIVGTVPDSYMEFESTSDSGEKQDFRE